MDIKTTDLCDRYSDVVRVAGPIGLKNFGGKKKFYGRIQTIKCFEDNVLFRNTLEQNGAGKVLIVDGGGSLRCALMGDMMGKLAVENKWNGVVVFGCVRDSVALSQLLLGVMALNTNPVRSGKRNEGQENVTVRFAGVDFVPEEFVYCDEDGIIVSQKDLAD